MEIKASYNSRPADRQHEKCWCWCTAHWETLAYKHNLSIFGIFQHCYLPVTVTEGRPKKSLFPQITDQELTLVYRHELNPCTGLYMITLMHDQLERTLCFRLPNLLHGSDGKRYYSARSEVWSLTLEQNLSKSVMFPVSCLLYSTTPL